jgi:hypothetical protein
MWLIALASSTHPARWSLGQFRCSTVVLALLLLQSSDVDTKVSTLSFVDQSRR